MLKAPRFLKEYANYQRNYINSQFPLMNADCKRKAAETIDHAVYLYEHSFITLDESMRLIMGCLDGIDDEQLGFC